MPEKKKYQEARNRVVTKLVDGSPDNEFIQYMIRANAREQAVNILSKFDELSDVVPKKEIAAVDLFVEKAQDELRSRAKNMNIAAYVSLFVSLVIVIATLSFIRFGEEYFLIDHETWQSLFADIVRNATFVGIMLGMLYVGISLFRSFKHEATVLENRVHSMRLGRLYIYLKFISAKEGEELSDLRSKLTAEEMVTVFGWNIETSTAFQDIDPHNATKTIIGTLVEKSADAIGGAKK